MAHELTRWGTNIPDCGENTLNKVKSCISLLGVALLSMMACADAESPGMTGSNFPRQHQNINVRLQALLVGELVSENGCLRVRDIDGGDNHLLIWPYSSKMTADRRSVLIGDDSEATLSVGEDVRIGGGEVPPLLSHVQTLVVQPIPSNCLGGSYWLVGEVSTTSE